MTRRTAPMYALALSLAFAATGRANDDQHLLLQKPTLSKTQIVFAFAGDLWSVPRDGGDAIRLTAGTGTSSSPIFSPDGSKIAYQGDYEGNVDVYVIPAAGGIAKRLTYHPAADIPVGWTPDGQSILFRSSRNSYSRFPRLFTISVEGGFPQEMNLPEANSGAYSADASRLAYMPIAPAFEIWKRYRGGQTTPIWIATLSDAHIEKVPRDNSNDFNPMWIGNRVFFLSDRNGSATLYSYDLSTKAVAQEIRDQRLDIKSANAGPGAIVYEQLGAIYLFDLQTGKTKEVSIHVAGDLPQLRPTFINVSEKIRSAKLSPTGARAVFEAHGEILTVPAEKGDVRNITNTPGIAERYPSWSPDGKQIAYFSDESGEYALHLSNQNAMGEVTKIGLGKPAFYYSPEWSPDSHKIAYTDSNLQLWYIDLQTRKPVLIDHDTYDTPRTSMNPSWSPDSKWITYTKILKNHLRAVFVYSLADGKPHQISDGMSDAEFALFDKNGKYLYFTASTNLGLANAWLDMSSDLPTSTRSVYLAVLDKNEPSPIAPESDEEKAADAAKSTQPDPSTTAATAAADAAATAAATPKADKVEPKPVNVHIDFENIDQRVVALPIPERDYVGMDVGKTGILFVREQPFGPGPPIFSEQKFDLKTRKTEKLLDGISMFEVSANGDKMLFAQGKIVVIASTATPPKPGDGLLHLETMQVRVDPKQEWKQMYHEVWRIERDFFYDPNLHGVNWQTAEKEYAPYVDSVSSRADLNYLFAEMLGELSVGHLFVRGDSTPDSKQVKVGLLGADYRIENGRYRFARVYNGENWNPEAKAPLTQPGVNVAAGEYLLEVSGRDVRPPANVYSFFEATAGHSVVLRVGPTPDGKGSREVTVVPIENEFNLRNLAWIEENRRKVDKLSGGKLAYVYLPNTAQGGFTNFNRYYFAQVGREGAVIDERFNGGGQIADYIIDELKRTQTNFFMTRAGEAFTTPQAAIFGPKAMIINEYAGSGGDAMPWLFRQEKVGPLVGKRTWGGLVGIFGFPPLIDGGTVTAPNLAFYNLKGEWDVENHGVPPDVEVDYDPAAVRAGHDPQLEKAVEILMAELREHPAPTYKRPEFPNYHRAASPAAATTGGRE